MKKRFKHLERNGKIYILRWTTDGCLFGPGWDSVAVYDGTVGNLRRCRTIVRLMNECDSNTQTDNDDRTRDT